MVERLQHAGAETAVVVHTDGDSDGLEPAVIMALEDAGHQVSDRVFAEVWRHVGDADLLVAIAFASPVAGGSRAVALFRKQAGTLLVVARLVGDGHEPE